MLRSLYKQNETDVVFENFGDEIVLINLKNGSYYSLNGPGSAIWELLLKNVAPIRMLEFVRQKHPENKNGYEDTFKNFISTLAAEGLIVSAGECAQTDPDPAANELSQLLDPKENAPAVPVIKIYTDQKELLLLDPIHEVSGLGWPDSEGKEPQDE